jgi:FkbM family methyltransferase
MHSNDRTRPEKTAQSLFSKHHVGGRNGRSGFPEMPAYNASIASTFYEADRDCCPQIEAELFSAGYGGVEVIPKCIGLSDQAVWFNLNFEPYTSSVLNFNQDYKSYYYDMGRFDYDYLTAMSPARKIQMYTVSLDETHPKYPIDFLSLDTQGSEFLILQGARKTLKNVVGIECEVSFRQIYKDGPLAGDITSYLNALGFEFIRFTTLTEDAPRSMPTLGRLNKCHTFGDALFLRRPENDMPPELQRKLVFASLAYGQVEYAAYCARHLEMDTSASSSETWSWFVDEFLRFCSAPTILPRGIGDVTNAEEQAARHKNPSEAPTLDLHPVKLLKFLFINYLPRQIQIATIRLVHAPLIARYFFGRPSKLEEIYERAGRKDLAIRLRKSRFRRIFPLF